MNTFESTSFFPSVCFCSESIAASRKPCAGDYRSLPKIEMLPPFKSEWTRAVWYDYTRLMGKTQANGSM